MFLPGGASSSLCLLGVKKLVCLEGLRYPWETSSKEALAVEIAKNKAILENSFISPLYRSSSTERGGITAFFSSSKLVRDVGGLALSL